jgi:hypothetical protein
MCIYVEIYAKHNVTPCNVAMLCIAYISKEIAVLICPVAAVRYKIFFQKLIADSEFQFPCTLKLDF